MPYIQTKTRAGKTLIISIIPGDIEKRTPFGRRTSGRQPRRRKRVTNGKQGGI